MSSNLIKSSSIGQIQNKSLREHVLEMLHAAIINGELKPGQALLEADLAAQLGVSRAPVREAINILNAEGLVETVPYHGTKVKNLLRKDIEELYSIRSLLEGFAIQCILLQADITPAIERLRAVCNEMMQAADAGSLRDVNQIDRKFHDTLVAASDNTLLVTMWGTVALRVRQVMALRNQRQGDLHQIARNHYIITELIERRATEEAVNYIHQHIGTAGDLIAQGWKQDEASNND